MTTRLLQTVRTALFVTFLSRQRFACLSFARLSDSFHAHLVALLVGVTYGLVAQVLARLDETKTVLGVMSVGYVFVLPAAIGFITVLVSARRQPISFWRAVLTTVSAVLLCLLAALFSGLEGFICLFLALPVYLPLGAFGGVAGWWWTRRRHPRSKQVLAYSLAMMLPLGSSAIEQQFESPLSIHLVETHIDIAAPVSDVWPLVVQVKAITEPISGVFYRLGFPKPLEAVLEQQEVGGVRLAKFAGDLTFVETITAFDPERRLSFSIKADPNKTPDTTLDPHVTVGGEYFDVLMGEYTLVPLSDSQTRLELRSRFRVSTKFNAYAGWWGDFLMQDIQNSILRVQKQRAERGVQ